VYVDFTVIREIICRIRNQSKKSSAAPERARNTSAALGGEG
jgi:hypothetical protein